MSKIMSLLKNETITYEIYIKRCKISLATTIGLYFLYGSNLFSFNFVFLLGVLLAYATSIIFTLYNLYRAIMAGLGVYNLKGLLKVFKKMIDKI